MREGGTWTLKSLYEELQHRGWESKTAQDPLKAAEAALTRLVSVKKEVERVGRGEYRYVGVPGSTASAGDVPNFAPRNEDQAAPPLMGLPGFREQQS
jgi:hypothetical protein